MGRQSVKIGELEIPKDYFKLDPERKRELCLEIMDGMLRIIHRNTSPSTDQIQFLYKIIESSINTNEEREEYEICQVLYDIKSLIDE